MRVAKALLEAGRKAYEEDDKRTMEEPKFGIVDNTHIACVSNTGMDDYRVVNRGLLIKQKGC